MGRIMALDLGERRIGVALSDPLGLTAQPLATIARAGDGATIAQIGELVARHEVAQLVLGLPRRTDGSEGPEAEAVRVFGAKVSASLGVDVRFVDERFTTRQAQRALIAGDVSRRRRKEQVDRLAATLILQQVLDSRS